MRSRWSVAAVVVALIAGVAMPAVANDDEQWDQDDGSLRQRHHRHRREQTIVPNNGTSNATQPYWGTMQPYWGTMQPYWGPSAPPPQQPHGLTPLNRRPR